MRLQGKTALVTGSARGIGRAIALKLAKAGANICIQYNKSRTEAETLRLEILDLGVKCHLIQAHLFDADSSKALIEEYLKIFAELHILVNCIGDFMQKPLSELKPEEFRQIINSNLNIAFDLCHFALPQLRGHGQGRILNIGYASANQIEPKPGILSYHIAKMGLILLTKSLSQSEAEHNILVNCLSPGIAENSLYFPKNKIPLNRPATLLEIAEAALFLLSSDYLTGVNLEIDGGWRGSL